MKINLWDVAVKIVEQQKAQGKKNYQIAAELGYEPATVGRWLNRERGRDRPNAKVIQRIIDVYGINFRELLLEMYPDIEPETITFLLDEKRDLFDAFLKLVTRKDEYTDKLESDIKFLLKNSETK